MTATELISLTVQVLFVGLFGAVLWHAVRQPSRSSLNTVLLFGSIAAVVLISRLAAWLSFEPPWLTGVVLALLNLAPIAMIRLVDDFSGTPRWLSAASIAIFVAISALGFIAADNPAGLLEVLIAWFLVVGGYAAFVFAQAASRSRGITRRRMTAVAAGAVTFIAAITAIFGGALLEQEVISNVGTVLALASVIAFFLGFAPPRWIRRAWREPDLRSFLQRSIHLSTLADERRAVMELQRAAADAFGATGAAIGVADAGRGVLRYFRINGQTVEYPDDAFIGGRSYTEQRRIVAADAAATDPDNATTYRDASATTVIAAPITLEDRRIGVLTVYADRSPIFIEDDLWLLELLADQVGVLLEARALSAEAAGLRSREDAARLKEEFLSAAAHDLRTPLTVVLGQAELLERRVARDPSAPVDAAGISRIAREARRLRDLVSQLLDVQRLEQGAAVMDRHDADLREVVTAVQHRFRDHGLDLRVVLPHGAVVATVDQMRIEQVLDNLVENALKYTSNGRLPEVHLETDEEGARISVVDQGVGIPADERERVFERFYRASNVQAITDTGMGLGLYICRRIIEAHGGRIVANETPGGGSTFVITVPLAREAVPAGDPETTSWPVTGAEAAADA